MKNIVFGLIFISVGIGIFGFSLYRDASNKKNPSPDKHLSQKTVQECKCPQEKVPECKCPECKCPVSNQVDKKNDLPEKPEDSMKPENVGKPIEPDLKKDEDYTKKEKISKTLIVYFAMAGKIPMDKHPEEIKTLGQELPKHHFEIGVRTGDRFDVPKNREMAKKRFAEIKKILIDSGVDEKNISARYFIGDPDKEEKSKFKSSYWRRARIRAYFKRGAK
ncbi:hypothetical protein KKF34_13505 [Myxococcota bacterium]|nr:hypothetical protein [Myxococcota bacterium]MBU1380564.1 hypothetical protein [Myxococcota bacterium]MBU1497886.1 hypothetical protein [Myxococcota bacterium]